jgi:tetratricopeptide (TPR) repeat protein
MASSMGEDNNLDPQGHDPKAASPEGSADAEATEAASEAAAAGAKGLTPGQRLAAKKALKAQHKRELKDEIKRKEEEEREKEREEAERLIAPPPQAALPDEVQQAAGTFTHFLQEHRAGILGSVAAVIALGLGGIWLKSYLRSGSAEQTGLLAAAIEVAQAPIDPQDTDGKTEDGEPVFKTREDRAQKAAEAFATAIKDRPDSIAASWGRLAEASIELSLAHPDKALALYQQVYDKNKGEPELNMRSLEGLGIALEASGKTDEASKRFEELKGLDKDLGEYHLARLKLAKGDRDGAKTLLKGLYDRLSDRSEGAPPSRYLRGEVETRLAELDSTLVDKGESGGTQTFSPEDIQRLMEQMRQQGGAPGGAE